MPGEGFEPSRVSSSHFECDASAISPPRLAEAREDDTTERSRSAGYPSLNSDLNDVEGSDCGGGGAGVSPAD